MPAALIARATVSRIFFRGSLQEHLPLLVAILCILVPLLADRLQLPLHFPLALYRRLRLSAIAKDISLRKLTRTTLEAWVQEDVGEPVKVKNPLAGESGKEVKTFNVYIAAALYRVVEVLSPKLLKLMSDAMEQDSPAHCLP